MHSFSLLFGLKSLPRHECLAVEERKPIRIKYSYFGVKIELMSARNFLLSTHKELVTCPQNDTQQSIVYFSWYWSGAANLETLIFIQNTQADFQGKVFNEFGVIAHAENYL